MGYLSSKYTTIKKKYRKDFITINIKKSGTLFIDFKGFKNVYINYTIDQAIKDFKKLYERKVKEYEKF